MVFKRRDRRPIWTIAVELLFPRGGWVRAFEYVKHRLRRLPDPPHRIARGIWAGVFTTFTPFYGLHFVVAAIVAMTIRGNVLAAMLATFFGNPLTYVPIIAISLNTGYALLGIRPKDQFQEGIGERFWHMIEHLWANVRALFTDDVARWGQLLEFWREIFYPFLIGGIIPGVIAATVAYYLSVPVIRVYQNRRKGRIKKKLAELKAKAGKKAGSGQRAE